ncbi:hypothetical protein ACHHYP_12027 [Achlya hypogyna]|uniref:RING-type domain-containing protein n=1 Tax=Achlya hypogyna TaxID=1202772 RepID=A0A1V9YHP1_ACHHY|nr:hypothetical protein ACHHYP_12027 [Achlya hypogyna]
MRRSFLSFLGHAGSEPTSPMDERASDAKARPRATSTPFPRSSLSLLSTTSLRQNLVSVEATPMGPAEAHFTQYTVICTQPGTHQWWVTFRRYSEFAAFRKQCTRAHKAACKARHAAALAPFADVLNTLCTVPFPRKHIVVDDQRILDERKAGFVVFVTALLVAFDDVSRLAPYFDADTRADVDNWLALVIKFLAIPPAVRQQRRHHTILNAVECVCAVCLDPINEPDEVERTRVFETRCQHRYHRKCILPWLETTQTCPMCRHRVLSGRWY